MAKVTRWLKGLLGMKSDKENLQSRSLNASSIDRKEKKRWSFGGKSTRGTSNVVENDNIPANISSSLSASDAAWHRTYIAESESEQNKHAIAVAAATAAAADTAVAAAHAAAAVVRLTSQGKGMLNGKRERCAAVKIQTVFRGFLARKALRALKGLIKVQALLRGNLVRKKVAATLHRMHALIRAQTAVRTQRAQRSFNKENRFGSEFHSRKSLERFDQRRSEYHSKRLSTTNETSINGFDESSKTYKPRSRSRKCKFSAAHSTPRFANPPWSNAPAKPAKRVCGDSFCRPYSNYPSYMANTQVFQCQIEFSQCPKAKAGTGAKEEALANEILAAINSISNVRMHRSSAQFQEEAFNC